MTKETILEYGTFGSIEYITTERGNVYLDWRCLQNILKSEGEIKGRKITLNNESEIINFV